MCVYTCVYTHAWTPPHHADVFCLALTLHCNSDSSLVCFALLLIFDFFLLVHTVHVTDTSTAPNKLWIPSGQVSSDIPEAVWSE